MLCSFDFKECKNENICLQNSAKISVFDENKLLETEKNKKEKSIFESGALATEAGDELENLYDLFISRLPEGVSYNPEDMSGMSGVEEAFDWLFSSLSSEKNAKTLALFVMVGIFISLAEIFASDIGSEASGVKAAVCVILSAPVFKAMADVVSEVAAGISDSSEFFSGIIPVLTGILAIGGTGAAASVSGAAMSVSLGFVTSVLAKMLLPLSSMMFSVSMVSAFDTDGITTDTAKGIRSIFNFLIGISSLIIVGALGVQTVIAVSGDNLALKSAKYALSGMIPVVGGTVSSVLSALISGVKLLSSFVGGVSVIALVSIISAPLIRLLFLRFCLFLCITVCSFSGGSYGQRFFSSVRGALDTLIAVFVSSSLIYLLEIIIVSASIRGAL